MREEAVRFGKNQSLVGILTLPENQVPVPTLLFLNAGMIHHVGPSRIYVRLARRLAGLGFSSLRFDFSGIGDSCPRVDDLSIEQAVLDDLRQAMDYLEARLNQSQFILIGHCGGAWAAFASAGENERVVGTILMNPEGTEEDWVEYDRQRKLSRYYENYYVKEALVDPERWKKLLTGRADYRSIYNNVVKTILLNKVSTAAFKVRSRLNVSEDIEESAFDGLLARAADAFIQRKVRLLLAFSKGSSSIEHFHVTLGKKLEVMMREGYATEVVIPNADHTFTMLSGQNALSDHVEDWCRTFISAAQHVPQ
ncbi:MAG: alpha/beta fold hydrolase [Anaerolineae bacterium]|nr:alpha/beta fold hydrolase [Anaerolineae bacterium]